MFYRTILDTLKYWANQTNRKPMILRGARQVGKTTAVNIFAKKFEQYIYLNLESEADKQIFIRNKRFEDLLEAIFFIKNKNRFSKRTLIFIDEIQMVSEAVAQLRYFYEKANDIYIIAAGSLLETLLNRNISFPVGRVNFSILHPCSFYEFLTALEERQVMDLLQKIPLPDFAHEKLSRLFHRYCLIGGMPEIVSTYVQNRDLTQLKSVYESLVISFTEDVEKYASNQNQSAIIRHIINNSFSEAGSRITFQGFGQSNYRSREMSEAFQLLEKTLLLKLIYPTTQVKLPVLSDKKKSPKLQIIDTGLINHFLGLQKDFIQTPDISEFYHGKIAEHIVGQELYALNHSPLFKLNFWVREKKQSSAEIDFVYAYRNKLIPVEVKSGTTGRLRSLQQFIDRSPHNYAVRIYSGTLSINKLKTINGKNFYLLNLPFYLVQKIEGYIEYLITESKKL